MTHLQLTVLSLHAAVFFFAGKSKLIDSVVAADICVMDTCVNRTEDCITVKSTGISLYCKMTDQSLRTFKGERDGNGYLINLIDTPGHVDFSSEVTAALRITDGALVVIDCVEGVCVQTETVLCQAHAEMVSPVLASNKIDRCFMDLNLDGEEMYQQLSWFINNANEHMTKYGDDVKFCPVKGTVAFSAGVHGWAFTLTNFAKIFAPTFDFDEYKMAEKLWGENFYDTRTKEWSTENTGSATCIRGFAIS
jgi:elongation factor 2